MSSDAVTPVTEMLKTMRDRAVTSAPRAAVTAMAALGTAATKLTLAKASHARGEPAGPAGEPPSTVSGTLLRSIRATPAVSIGTGRAMSTVGSDLVYSRIQELGGIIEPGKLMVWQDSGGKHFARRVELPARPYFGPTMEALVSSGKLTEVAELAWTVAIGLNV